MYKVQVLHGFLCCLVGMLVEDGEKPISAAWSLTTLELTRQMAYTGFGGLGLRGFARSSMDTHDMLRLGIQDYTISYVGFCGYCRYVPRGWVFLFSSGFRAPGFIQSCSLTCVVDRKRANMYCAGI